ncbi:heavy metal translocating P-type ATPase [Actinomycetaceae bacterium MB13-C1-2]|nr:heavy metal translocating P-type ATPase [Actinomycetaceae bacterium MB13-C1-2]
MTKLEHDETAPDHRHGKGFSNIELWFAILAGITYGAGMLAGYVFKLPLVGVPLAFFLATYFFGGFFTFKEAIASTLKGRFEVDFLMLVAAIGAAAIGMWAEGAVLLFLFSLGHALEEFALGRASRSIEALAELAPRTALVRREADETVEIPVEELQIGDTVVVRPNSRIPADGFVVAGFSAVDQSAVTGESMPVEKEPVTRVGRAEANLDALPASNKVFAGTVNGSGVLEVRVSATAADSTLSRVVRLVAETDQTASRTQLFIERFQRWYVPAVIVGVVATLLISWLVLNNSFSDAFYLAMTILVAASPCALAIATPAAVLSGIARAARAGVLIKGGAPLETLGRIQAMAFDKTGTLTWGTPSVDTIWPTLGAEGEQLVPVLLAVESLSDHPLATAITRDLSSQVPVDKRLVATDLNSVTGRGLAAVIDGKTVEAGNLRMFTELGARLPDHLREGYSFIHERGQTAMLVRYDNQFLGVVGVIDKARGESVEVMSALRAAGVKKMIMISGDSQQVADAVGREVGVDQVIGGLLPEDKVTEISELTHDYAPIAMVGDGVNDAPAMAKADVAIAMGAAGSAVALETCDIALMSDDLGRVPFAVRLSRATSRIIAENLIVSLLVVVFLIVMTFFGLNIGLVVLIHEGSTLVVVSNALRLLNFERGKEHYGITHEENPLYTNAAKE